MTDFSSLTINNKTVDSITVDDKEVQSIVRQSDNAVIYAKATLQTDTFITDKQILSQYHNDVATLTLNYETGNTVTMKVYDITKTTLLDTLTVTDNNNNTYTATYQSEGQGDIIIETEYDNQTETIEIEDCIFYDATEYSKTTRNQLLKGEVYSPRVELTLPQNCIWEVDMKASSLSGSEDRMFLTATDFDGEQPSYAIFMEFNSQDVSCGFRFNGQTEYGNVSSTQYSVNTYHSFRLEKTSRDFVFKFDNASIGTMSDNLGWVDSAPIWWFAFACWKRPSITMSWKNMKIKVM